MEILLIGNGFDLEHNLPTSYQNFLDFCEHLRKIYTFDRGISKSEYKINVLDNWNFDEGVKNLLLDAYENRYIDSASSCLSESDTGIRTNYSELNEMYFYIQHNTWLEYFGACLERVGANWIDFEAEISRVIQAIDEARMYLSQNEDILNSKIKDDAILLGAIYPATGGSRRNGGGLERSVKTIHDGSPA